MRKILFLVFPLFMAVQCQENTHSKSFFSADSTKTSLIDTTGSTLATRILPPEGYTRTAAPQNSFAYYLRNLPLKKHNSLVHYYNGTTKPNNNIYCAVVDMKISNRDLQQCADAVMRLKAEYLYHNKEYEKIRFNFLSDAKPRYYVKYAKNDYSYSKFLKYMDYIFAYANTGSLSDELQSVPNLKNIQIGDVFVEKKQPFGHAIIVVDRVENAQGEKLFLLAQSYMPAQETQILINPNNADISPWYSTQNTTLFTPEWQFKATHLKRFPY